MKGAQHRGMVRDRTPADVVKGRAHESGFSQNGSTRSQEGDAMERAAGCLPDDILIDTTLLAATLLDVGSKVAAGAVFHHDVNLGPALVDDAVVVPHDVGVPELAQDIHLPKSQTVDGKRQHRVPNEKFRHDLRIWEKSSPPTQGGASPSPTSCHSQALSTQESFHPTCGVSGKQRGVSRCSTPQNEVFCSPAALCRMTPCLQCPEARTRP